MADNWRDSLDRVKREQQQARGYFEKDPDVQAMIEAVTAAAAALLPGHVLAWERITEVIGLTREDSRFWSVVKAWRDRLRKDRQIETWVFGQNEGVTLLRNDQNIEVVARKRTQRAVRQSKRVLTAIANTDRAQLTDKMMLVAHHYEERAKAAIARVKADTTDKAKG